MSTITGRKVRADAKLEQLNEAQREQLHFWFEESCTYYEVTKLLRETFGISVGRSAVSAYYRRHILPQQQDDDREVVATLAALPAGDFDAATLQRTKALLWSALAQINPDVDLAVKLSGIIEKAERRALAVRKLELEERKVALREKLAAERAAAAERRNGVRRETTPAKNLPCEAQDSPRFPGYFAVSRPEAEAELETTKPTKRPERGDASAEMVGRSEGTEAAAKAQSCEGRSEEPEEAPNPRRSDSMCELFRA